MLNKVVSKWIIRGSPQKSSRAWESVHLEDGILSLRQGGSPPPLEILVSFLHQCRNERNLAHAMYLHCYLKIHGLDVLNSIGNLVVTMLVEVGCVSHAQRSFNMLLERNEYSWNSLISGYARCGDIERALFLYKRMRDHPASPTSHTFVALLKVCAKFQSLERGRELHADIIMENLERNLFVGSALVYMYGKCGELVKAHQVFDQLVSHDVVSWNVLAAGCAKHGKCEEVFACFKRMESEGIYPNAITYICGLKACGSTGVATEGTQLHMEISRRGLLEQHCLIGNALVDMYAKCGLLVMAEEVLDLLPVQEVTSWNSLITGYIKNGHNNEALSCFDEMQLDGITPDAVTFVCVLKACSICGYAAKGREIHTMIERSDLMNVSGVGNALVDMYASFGSLEKAQELFDNLLVRDVVSWTTMITKYTGYGRHEEVLDLFEEMKAEGVSPNAVTLICSLKACSILCDFKRGDKICNEVARLGFLEKDTAVGNALINMYANCGWLAKAQDIFDRLPHRDVISWTALIEGYGKHEYSEQAVKLFEKMQQSDISPDDVTFVCILNACRHTGVIGKGIKIHDEISRRGLLERDLVVGNALINMYANCGMLSIARDVLNRLPLRDLVSWTTLIAGYVKHDCGVEALECFEEMGCKGITPDALTFVYSLQACGDVGAGEKGQEVHAEVMRRELLETDPLIVNALIDMYAKCGILHIAREVFDMHPDRDEISWNSLITGYSQWGEWRNVFHLLERMGGENWKPNSITFVSILNVCSHAGLIDMARMFFDVMNKDHGIDQIVEHHNCMIDLLCRAGQLENAIASIRNMPFPPKLVVWHILMAACKKWGNLKLAAQAFQHALWIDDNDASAYVYMSNIYADDDIQDR